jgi:hypothetical protein
VLLPLFILMFLNVGTRGRSARRQPTHMNVGLPAPVACVFYGLWIRPWGGVRTPVYTLQVGSIVRCLLIPAVHCSATMCCPSPIPQLSAAATCVYWTWLCVGICVCGYVCVPHGCVSSLYCCQVNRQTSLRSFSGCKHMSAVLQAPCQQPCGAGFEHVCVCLGTWRRPGNSLRLR